jgi:hypothetical protein
MLRSVIVLAATVLSAWLCSTSADGPECSEARARSAIGERYSPELGEKIARAAGARVVREVERGRAYTRELVPDRLNLEVDHRGVVIGVGCG